MEDHIVGELFEAAEKNNIAFIRESLPAAPYITNSNGQTLLHIAAGFGKLTLVSYLIKKGADVNAQDLEGQAPLHNACCHNHKTTAQKLIEKGALVNLQDYKGWTPLHFALNRNNFESYKGVVDVLLDSDADPYLNSRSGRNCLQKIKDNEYREYIKLKHLLNKLNLYKDTEDPLTHRLREEIIDKYLLVEDYFEIIKKGDEKLSILELLTTPKLIRSQLITCNSITPLHRAAGYGYPETAKFLERKGADVNATDINCRTPLHYAAEFGHIDLIKFLIKKGSNVNAQDLIGYSPLHIAGTKTIHEPCLLLIESGANINLRCHNGNIPFDLATSGAVKEVLKPACKEVLIPAASSNAFYVAIQATKRFDEDDPPIYDSVLDQLMMNSDSDEPLFENSQHNIKKIILPETHDCYQKIKHHMNETIVTHDMNLGGHFRSYDILSIEQILNKKVWYNYRKMCDILNNELGYKNEKLLFHGSKKVDDIQNFGFNERYAQRDGMFGTGIYFAKNSSKSNQYAFGLGSGCQLHSDKSCYICERKIILAQVALGRSYISKEPMPDCSHGPPGYWSVTGEPGKTDDLLYHEYVIYKGAQAYPLFVIRYRIMKP